MPLSSLGVLGLADKEQLLRDLAVLRRVERQSPHWKEIGDVRTTLERLIGPTVSRAMAARTLGVSQTAFDRRLKSGDIPYVVSPEGRREVPLSAAVGLTGAIDQHRGDNPDDPHPLASVLREQRLEAQSLDPGELLPRRYRRGLEDSGHRLAELRGLAYHRAVAQRLDQSLVEEARRRLRAWRAENRIDQRYADRWESVLSRPRPAIEKFIGRDSQEARDLRQNSPFAGVLSEPERRRVLQIVG